MKAEDGIEVGAVGVSSASSVSRFNDTRVPPTRHDIRKHLGKLSEIAILRLLGRVPRKPRRASARRMGNAAYRVLYELPGQATDKLVSRPVVAWVVQEYQALTAQVKEKLGTEQHIDIGPGAAVS